MSKYIKLEDAIHNINLEVVGRKEYTGDMKANLFFALDDLPTIEIVACDECRWSNDCSQLIENLEHTASTSLRWCSDGVRRAEGEWVHIAGSGYRCSNCNECTKSEKPFHKPKGDCPNCGAKMKVKTFT